MGRKSPVLVNAGKLLRGKQLKRLQKPPGKVRIIGGQWRGTRLTVTDMEQLRPTPNRARETVFNWLRDQVTGAVCLDLFAGSGALGFEAASRGAARVIMVEQNRNQVAVLRRQVEILQAQTIEIVQADALQWLSATAQSFNLVFLDPPFATVLLDKSLALLQRQATLRPDGMVYVESELGQTIAADELQIVKQGRAGQVQYMLLARRNGNKYP